MPLSVEETRRYVESVLTREVWLNDEQVAAAGGPLFLVWDGHRYRAPAWQVDPRGRIWPQVHELLDLLPDDSDRRLQLVWLRQPNRSLDGQSPVDRFATDPTAVLEVVRRTWKPDDRDW